MRFVLTAWGSLGDLHPYLAIGIALKKRGHVVTLTTGSLYREKVEGAGLRFARLRPELPDNATAQPLFQRVMDGKDGTRVVIQDLLMPALRATFDDVTAACTEANADLLVNHPIVYGGAIAAEKHGWCWLSTVLQPIFFASAYDVPVPPSLPSATWVNRLPVPLGRLALRLGKRQVRPWGEAMTTLRRELGLPPLLNPIFDHHSPHGTLALFSSVLAMPQPDWFPNTTLTGFPFYEEGTLSAELEDFLRPLDAPLLFTLGSAAVETAGTFWERSVQVAQSLNRRAILLVGKRPVGVPSSLPLGILAVPYAPHALLMPRCAAIIHQGGVGTTGQALRSGRPQLVVPFAHDQPDNATRVVRLGCGLSLPIGSYTTATAFKRLRWLLGNDAYATRARAVGDQVASENGAERAAKEITSFLRV